MNTQEETIDKLFEILGGMNYRSFSNESELQEQVEDRLRASGIKFRSQVPATKRDRFDILLPGGIVLELKTNGSASALLSQLERYAQHEDVTAIVVVTSRSSHRQIEVVHEVYGKPVRVIHVGSL